MSKKTIGIVISSICFLASITMAVMLYSSYIGAFQGKTTVGEFMTYRVMGELALSWLIRIAAFFPSCVLFRRILKWNRGVKCGLLIAVIIVPGMLSSISNTLFLQCVETLSDSRILIGTFWGHILIHVVYDAISTIIWVAGAYGLGLLGNTPYQTKTGLNKTTTESSVTYSYLEQYKQHRSGGNQNVQ